VTDTYLFSPLTLRGVTFRNRIGVSPMCQYSAENGFVNDWHFVHLGSRAVGGAGLVIMEATGVTPEGRISPACTGIWDDAHIAPLKRITDFIKAHGAVPGIQIAHAGRKASTGVSWQGGGRLLPGQGGWEVLAPSAIPFQPDHPLPKEMNAGDIEQLITDFVTAAKRAVAAGFQVIELHGAHGYLLHEFFSSLSNKRSDAFGGTRENRARLTLDIAAKIRAAIPDNAVLGARLSCVDWIEGGIAIEDSIWLASELKKKGVDFIDCSSGFVVPGAKIPFGPGYQAGFAKQVRTGADISTAAVGFITEAKQADAIIRDGSADIVLLARAMLRDPYWPIHAAKELGIKADVPNQYLRGY